jgi:hypothetical protein
MANVHKKAVAVSTADTLLETKRVENAEHILLFSFDRILNYSDEAMRLTENNKREDTLQPVVKAEISELINVTDSLKRSDYDKVEGSRCWQR